MTRTALGSYGFSVSVDADDTHLVTALTIEGLGFSTLWINGGALDRLDRLTDLLSATSTSMVGSSIIPPDRYGPDDVSRLYESAEEHAPGRLVVGLGSPHRHDALAVVQQYLDKLEVPPQRRMLAAFGPRALRVARERFAGAMPMLFTPEYTTVARRSIGDDRTLSVGLYAVLDEDPVRARTTARQPLTFLTSMASYQRSLGRQQFSAVDVAGISDHLVDTLVAWGTPADVIGHAERLRAAGADHVHLTVLGENAQPTGLSAARRLAAEFG